MLRYCRNFPEPCRTFATKVGMILGAKSVDNHTDTRKFYIFFHMAPQPMVSWTNGGLSESQGIKKVQTVTLAKFLTVVVMHQQVVKLCWSNFENRKIRDVLACRPQLVML